MISVSVKWQKEVFESVEIDTSQPPLVFKAQLYALSSVPPERQKIMVKGGMLKDDGEWTKYGVKQGQRLMMMGSADAIPVAPEKSTVFVEDLPEEDQEGALELHSSGGLVNLGNTCYMNSSLQCLRSVPELKTALGQYTSTSGQPTDSSHSLTLAMKDLFGEMERTKRPVAPFRFLQVMRAQYPQFAQQGEHGYMQQDAEECWTQLVYSLSQRLKTTETPSAAVMKHLFGIEMKNTLKCVESGEETSEKESVLSLKCHITSEVNQLEEGMKGSLKGEVEKVSSSLGRSALHIKESLVDGLPPYMTVQFVRFFWKRDSQQKAKILRKVGYPLVFDAYDLCTPEVKEKLTEPRKALRALEDAKAGVRKSSAAKKLKAESNEADSAPAPQKDSDTPMADAKGEGASEPVSAPTGNVEASSSSSPPPRQSATGYYDLVSVLTHKGRSADSGHYVAWVKEESGQWVEFDDEKPIPRKEEDITNLSGGGDWHMAYILVYKARTVAMG